MEEFELLKGSHSDLASVRWKEPTIREAMKRHQRIKRAHEELERLHIEIARVYEATQHEKEHFARVLKSLRDDKDPLLIVVEDHSIRRSRVNDVIIARLKQIVAIPGYTGPPLVRRCRKGEVVLGHKTNDIGIPGPSEQEDSDLEDNLGDQEEIEAQVGGLIDFIADLTIR